MIDYLKHKFDEQDISIAFIYCNYKEKEDQTTVNLMASLIQHLLQRRPVIPGHLLLLYNRHNRKKTRLTLAECSELLRMELNACSRAFIVVDALDKCDETSGTRRDLISQLLRLPPNTYLMVTSRDVPSIQHELNVFRRIDIRASDADVRNYVEGRIGREGRLKSVARSRQVNIIDCGSTGLLSSLPGDEQILINTKRYDQQNALPILYDSAGPA
jgi:hypothetical protein